MRAYEVMCPSMLGGIKGAMLIGSPCLLFVGRMQMHAYFHCTFEFELCCVRLLYNVSFAAAHMTLIDSLAPARCSSCSATGSQGTNWV